ncbi:diguanylate cyclase domain-containing protein [Treponema sp.]|uniref:GGDEF domain-containing protein n=1 Tax=Treponema sp. TaxID=166 RepID=UPI003890B68F
MFEIDKLTPIEKKLFNLDSPDSYKIDVSKMIHKSYLTVLFMSSLLMMVVFLLMFTMSFFASPFYGHRFFYLLESLGVAVVFTLCCTVLKKSPIATIFTVQLFNIFLYSYGIYIGVISQNDNLAVTACLFLAILPMLFTSRPLIIASVSTSWMIITIVLMVKFKSPKILVVDVVDVVFSWLMGVGLGITTCSLKVKNFVRERQIALERDIDGLTGLLNKTAYERKIKEYLSETNNGGAFFMMDLDKFKLINDTYGHSYGDEVLVRVSECMQKCFDSEAVLGRFGGDEFVFFIPHIDETKAMEAARNLLTELHENVKLKAGMGGIQGSVGIAMVSSDAECNYESILIKSDKALYATKEQGRFGYTVYSDGDMKSFTKLLKDIL